MLKVNFIKKKNFSIKKRFLDKPLLGSLESQSHLLEAGGLLAPGQGSLHEAWRRPRPWPGGVLRAEVGLVLQCR